MKRFIQGEHRGQSTLLPESLDDYVSDTNPVRVVDVFVDELDLITLGFESAVPAETGRPGYHPAVMLKIYIYGYLNRIQSSRRLEREAQRNVELMWLTGRLMPDFKTIANFRKDNGKAIRGVCRQFVVLCQQLGLFSENLIAIDGSKFKAVNHRDRNFTSAKLKKRMEEIESSIARYLKALDAADREEPKPSDPKSGGLEEKIAKLKEQMKALQEIEIQVETSPDKQVSLTDPDARSMMTSGKGIVGYNVQTAVDTKHHLIVAHEVTNVGHDRDQLSSMAVQAREAMKLESLSVVADRGYYKSGEILACHEAAITAYVPKTQSSRAKFDGRFNNDAFIYDADKDVYVCPAKEVLTWRNACVDNGKTLNSYWSSNCRSCSIKAQCTPARERKVRRWEHEAVLEEMQVRLDEAPEMMKIRKRTVEHPFGTLKQWMGATHFLTRRLAGVSTEMSLNVLAYNLKRVMKILGAQNLMKALAA
ncbi:IS1182 family transposase [Pseudomonas sp. TH41]|uniref:IS1182 family transposase n=1 Tax=Pseudomonas sp. TH41 TaxID=2796405 RepID=UPI001914416D|nr:IS1182 family transposase [Pseudomonas sp. TH41]MBK5351050.1 IS1182 family transposase [Pseudomonas sp. TH41]MBK5352036.1 IS1182 family transposase [Pseudomonas sp. TH41]MBK5352261.1 IS1182 family transposase [Pseudomonas sp. TH41]MBK5352411.1 IS1182 family transposase [Pseudomonas sp. TH41]MBK5354353.1 IS1182 family transposase [Pseudomonas sp. TH41]